MDSEFYNINDQHKIGKLAEATIKKRLEKLYPTDIIKDVSEDPNFFDDDIDFTRLPIDFIGSDKSDRELYEEGKCEQAIEVKGDKWNETGNLFYEIISNVEFNTAGCHRKTKADTLYHVGSNLKEAYHITNVPEFKKFCENWIDEQPLYDNNGRTTKKNVYNDTKVTQGYAIPARLFTDQSWITKVTL